jgi:hypothetical protein
LCFGDLVAADLLTTTLGRAWWSAAEGLAWIITGVPLEWKEWAGLQLARHMEEAGKELARVIGEDQVRAQGRLSPQGLMESLPSSDLRIPGFRWLVRPDGNLGTSPPGRLAIFQGRHWYGIEVDSDGIKRTFPKPLRAERWPLIEAERLYAESGSESAAREPEPAPPSRQVEPEPPQPARRGPPEKYDWDEGFQFMRSELDKRGDPKKPINAVKGWRSDADVARLVAAHIAIGDQQPDHKHTARVIRPKLKEWRAEQAKRN